MKIIIKITFLLLLTISLTNCSSDDNPDQNNPDNFIVYDGNTTELDKGYVSIEDHYAEIALFSPNIDIGQGTGAQGQGPYILLTLNSEEASTISSGTYNVDNDTQEQTHFFDDAIFIDNSLTPPAIVNTSNGTVEITQGGLGNLSLTFDVVDNQGAHVTGKWSGDLTIFN